MKLSHPPDSKHQALQQQNVLYANATKVADELFQTLEFFDPRDLLQVKYEMVRRVHKEGWPVSRAAAAFGFSRISYYRTQHAIQTQGVMGLMPRKRGPTHPSKITDSILLFMHQRLEEQPGLSPGKLRALVATECGVQVHKRTIERALRGKKKLRSPAAEMPGGQP